MTEKQKQAVLQQGKDRIAAYRRYVKDCCISEHRMRRILAKGKPVVFARIRFRVGSVVRSKCRAGSLWLVVGHSFTGVSGLERGCHACRITDRVHKRWEWIGPEAFIEKA